MKYFFILILLCLIGCEESPRNSYIEYSLSRMEYVPKNDKQKFSDCVSNIMKGASNRLTTSDYENVDAAIDSAHNSCTKIFRATKVCLQVYTHDERNTYTYSTNYFDPDDLKGHYLEIFQTLQTTNQVYIREAIQ